MRKTVRMLCLAMAGAIAVGAVCARGAGEEGPVLDGETLAGLSFLNGFVRAMAREKLQAEYEGVKAQVLTWDGAGNWTVEREQANEATWPDVQFTLDETGPVALRLVFCRNGEWNVSSANAVGYVKRTVPAGKWQIVSIPYRNFAAEDGMYKFGETQVANDLPQGSSVLFWSEGDQAWSVGGKTAKGWGGAVANHVLGSGEAFFVKGPGGEDIDVPCGGVLPGEETVSRDFAAGKWSVMAPPYPVDGEFKDTGAGQGLALGDTVLFWDVERQGWSGGGKNTKGWPAGLGGHEVEAGEGFFVKSEAGGSATERKPYGWP